MAKSITPELEELIIKLAREGKSGRQIVAHLQEQKGVAYSLSTVQRALKVHREVREETIRDVAREHFGKAIQTDSAALDAQLERMTKLEVRLHERTHKALDLVELTERRYEAGEVPKDEGRRGRKPGADFPWENASRLAEVAIKATNASRAVIDRKLHYAGASPGDPNDSAANKPTIFVPEEDTDDDTPDEGAPKDDE